MSELDEFMEILGTDTNGGSKVGPGVRINRTAYPEDICHSDDSSQASDYSQWYVLPNNQFCATGTTIKTLHSSVYSIAQDSEGRVVFSQTQLVTDELLKLPDTASAKVLSSIHRFWEARNLFIKKKQVFKRGMLLWGPPGSGKTVTVTLLMLDLIRRDGIVILGKTHPNLVSQALQNLRRIEPNRPAIVVLEDLDELIDKYGESDLLSLLDGENQVNNVVYLATTNYPENLDPRFINRPSRFDEVIKIGMPSDEARAMYLRAKLNKSELSDSQLATWVVDTKGMSIAHLRELTVAVYCLGRDYNETIQRLKSMKITPKSTDSRTIGYGNDL